jgi:hypothetical protein
VNIFPFIGRRKRAAQCQAGVPATESLLVPPTPPLVMILSDRDRQGGELTVLITAEHKRSKDRYGASRMYTERCRKGHSHSRKRVGRLMHRVGLRREVATVEDRYSPARGRCRTASWTTTVPPNSKTLITARSSTYPDRIISTVRGIGTTPSASEGVSHAG